MGGTWTESFMLFNVPLEAKFPQSRIGAGLFVTAPHDDGK
ncbi:hypothetical protein QO009_000133 [Brevibacillus aydinogluensis]|jgi:hypothetical protein|uniref:Uncharacterized protein n=1 Tax=Brevibacillus aydinogluensis TaxID=927786 RepID=A0AA48MC28_9BACL|nr:hypothetical protein [Brevibacillus aydinogluensis]CAJ1003490.1 hypothetical protein BSPP4475_14315 [Brevibacillus aydinogluensis]